MPILVFFLRKCALFFYAREWVNLSREIERAEQRKKFSLSRNSIENLAKAIVFAEDRRFYSHQGVDVVAIFRALVRIAFFGELQGGSTITQQLVRTLSRDYRRTVGRKLKEIILAILTDRHLSKEDQLRMYFSVAYFGWHMNGLREACARLQIGPDISFAQAAQIVARLRYPEPKNPSARLKEKINMRAEYIFRQWEREAH